MRAAIRLLEPQRLDRIDATSALERVPLTDIAVLSDKRSVRER